MTAEIFDSDVTLNLNNITGLDNSTANQSPSPCVECEDLNQNPTEDNESPSSGSSRKNHSSTEGSRREQARHYNGFNDGGRYV